MKYAIIIPARYASSRLPGKPLVEIAGKPMILRTFEQCAKAVDRQLIYVATDDERIAAICDANDINTVLTSEDCLTGTDRVAEAVEKLDVDIALNVQGDEPLFNPDDIKTLLREAKASPDAVINGYCEIDSEEQFRSPSVPKVVFRPDGRLLYMSRNAIPTTKDHGFRKAWRQVCAYAFPASALKKFSSVSRKAALEEIEDIEILRFLELGLDVRMIPMSRESIAVDHPEDVFRIERELSRRGA